MNPDPSFHFGKPRGEPKTRNLFSLMPPHPKPGPYTYLWNEGEANPWQGRDFNGHIATRESLIWTILTSEDWWFAAWEDIVGTHGETTAAKFWADYGTPLAFKAREKALRGTANFDWSEADLAFNVAHHDKNFAEMMGTLFADLADTDPERHALLLQKAEVASNGPEAVAANQKNLGEWLYRVIREGQAGSLDKLASLIRGGRRPKADRKNKEHGAALDGFARFVLDRKRLPTIKELTDGWEGWQDARKTRKLLGLSGLPKAKPR